MLPFLRQWLGRRRPHPSSICDKNGQNTRLEINLADVIAKDKAALASLDRRQEWLEARIDSSARDASGRLKASDRKGAMRLLKQKKLLETELDQIMAAKLTIEHQLMTLDSAQTHKIAMGALASGVEAQKVVTSQLSQLRLDELMEQLEEQREMQQQLNDMFNENSVLVDENEVQAELLDLEAKELELRLLELQSIPTSTPRLVPRSIDRTEVKESSEHELEIIGLRTLLSEDAQLGRIQAELAL